MTDREDIETTAANHCACIQSLQHSMLSQSVPVDIAISSIPPLRHVIFILTLHNLLPLLSDPGL